MTLMITTVWFIGIMIMSMIRPVGDLNSIRMRTHLEFQGAVLVEVMQMIERVYLD